MKIKLITFIFCYFFTFLGSVYASSEATTTATAAGDHKFKIGFEFQENNHLCDWAAGMFAIQKQPIFTVSRGGAKLWEVVIDGQDIEFVTEPFSNTEEELLNIGIGSISMAFKLLCDFTNRMTLGFVTFRDWIEGVELKGAENVLVTLSDDKLDEHRLSKKIALIGIQKGLRRVLTEQGLTLEINADVFASIHDRPFRNSNIPGTWIQEFQPQVTIQHPLEASIPIISVLFNSSGGSITREIKTSMPTLDTETVPTKAEGLAFLHALTCSGLIKEVELDDKDNIRWVDQRFKDGEQIDGKVKLNFLSRRPFSNMWREIKRASDPSFSDLYGAKILSNSLFSEVATKMNFVNYAEEFYRDDLSGRLDFSELGAIFEAEFLTEEAMFLLSQGILTTSMLRHMNLPIMRGADASPSILGTLFNDHLNKLIASVDGPLPRYEFDPESKTVQEKATTFDSLSPLWFLDQSDSMGAYKDGVDTSYGEAIVEMRQIKEISKDVVEVIKASIIEKSPAERRAIIEERVTKRRFLVYNSTLLEQANGLFSFINSLSN